MASIRGKNENLVNNLGCCPLSCQDVFEALEQGDCFCLGLKVQRPEAAIADPSKLKIVDIVPTFMQSESFIDSATFNINKDGDAHGGFTKNQGDGEDADLAMGLGREKITGVLPVYLFKEHWDIARRRAPPIYGFLCTLDVMGFAPAQQYVVPFLVLQRAIMKAEEEDSSNSQMIEKIVLETCVATFTTFRDFREQSLALIESFIKEPEQRTQDIVPSIIVLFLQYHTLDHLKN